MAYQKTADTERLLALISDKPKPKSKPEDAEPKKRRRVTHRVRHGKRLTDQDEWREDMGDNFLRAGERLRQLAVDAAIEGNGRLARDLAVAAAVCIDKCMMLLGRGKTVGRAGGESRDELLKKLQTLESKAGRSHDAE